ncbi:hypothetical protein [Leptospira yasudae]|uniref:hypothetical protein n=1 Tax=Leptospira yasudae TaxID=2202201 RepID=UPI001090F7B4|nr:hypothetical protein [Leptospira yasudae]TGM98033.1 hypothetical protein EHR10_11195 [Leptospira yasudae]
MKFRLSLISFLILIGSLEGKPSSFDEYIKQVESEVKDMDGKSKNDHSTKRSDPDICEKYPQLKICKKINSQFDNDKTVKEK